MKNRFMLWIVAAACMALLNISTARAYNQNPNLNWGSTNIMDAILPPPGLYMSNYMVWYHSDEFKDAEGNDLPLENELDVLVYAPQLIWLSKAKLPHDLRFGAQGIIAFQNYELNSDLGLTAANNTIGDLTLGALVGSAVPLSKDFVLHWIFEFDTYVPIGEYDQENNLNPSANFFTLEPWFSITLQMPHGLTFSTRQHLSYNTTNDEYLGPDGMTHDLQPGMLYHANYSFMKTVDFISPNLRLGVVGYYGTQLEEDEYDDRDWDDVFGTSSEESVFSIGPAISYMHKGMVFSLKSYFESGVENRPEGERVVFRLTFAF